MHLNAKDMRGRAVTVGKDRSKRLKSILDVGMNATVLRMIKQTLHSSEYERV
jgi:hypothetical protein